MGKYLKESIIKWIASVAPGIIHRYKTPIPILKIVPKVNTQNYEVTGKLKSYDEYESFKLYLPESDEILAVILDAEKNNDFSACRDISKI